MERVRKLLLTGAVATLFVLLGLLLAAELGHFIETSVPPELLEVEPNSGLTRLQIAGATSGSLLALLLWRRERRSRRRRAFASTPADLAAQTALVAAWVEKASRDVTERSDLVIGELSAGRPEEEQPVAAEPVAFIPPQPTADPAAAADFVRWGQLAARAGDRMVAYRLFLQATRLDRYSELAWLWLAGTTDRRDEAIIALELVLQINPDNHWALQGLVEMQA